MEEDFILWSKIMRLSISLLILTVSVIVGCDETPAPVQELPAETLQPKLLPQEETVDAEAQYRLGWSFYSGDDAPQNYKEAIKWWTKAAENGHGGAQYNLGMMYENGVGILQDYKKAIQLYTEATKQEYVENGLPFNQQHWCDVCLWQRCPAGLRTSIQMVY